MNRKKEIILATLELAAEHGLGTVSMKQIADRVGITKASLYNHFASRDEIVDTMYAYLREEAKKSIGIGEVDYDSLTNNRSLNEILTEAVSTYKRICLSPQMYSFYKIIMSERTINKKAAEIMVSETKKMINATKMLFYALQVKGIAHFKDVDAAALSFSMAVQSIVDYECDLEHICITDTNNMMNKFIEEFSRNYG